MPRAEHTLKVDALVLRHSDWGEADRLLGLYTSQAGKIRCVAKGVRRLRSRKAGHLEPFTRVSLLLARGRDLWIVTQADTIDAFLSLKQNLTTTTQAAYIIELLDRFTYDEEPNPTLFRLVSESLQRLDGGQDPFLVLRYYEIRLLDHLGFRPQFFQCVRCLKDIQPDDQYFSAKEGGIVCPDCGRNQTDLRPISMPALKYMRHFQRSSYLEAKKAQVTAGIQMEMESLLSHYLTFLLERSLNSPQFLREVKS